MAALSAALAAAHAFAPYWLPAALALLAAYYLLLAPRASLARHQVTPSLAVVITGCDSGFGEALALRAAAAGFTVFAGCLTPQGVKRLRAAGEHLHAFSLDVTSERSIAEAVDEVIAPWLNSRRARNRALHALVNNAGIGASGLVDWAPLESFRRVMDVNYLGAVAVTKALLPLLMRASAAAAAARAPAPRVINVTSVAGLLAAPGLSAYCASKYALEAFSDALRREMAPWRLRVAIIEPSFLATPILANVKEKAQAQWEALAPATQRAWGGEYHAATLARGEGVVRGAEPPALGVDALFQALCHVHPAARYRAGTPGRTYLPLLAALPAWAADPLFALSAPAVVPAGMRGEDASESSSGSGSSGSGSGSRSSKKVVQ